LSNEAEEAARNLLLDWAAQRHASGEASLSELAAETGVPIEVIEEHVIRQRSAVEGKRAVKDVAAGESE
jgi:hypothetical protein